MRITILHRSGRGAVNGGTRLFTDYAEWLAERGHDVLLVSPENPRKPLFEGPLRRLPLYKEPVSDETFFRNRRFRNKVLECDRPVRADDLPDADLLIGTWYETCLWMKDLPPEKGRKVHFVQDLEIFPYLPQDKARDALYQPFPKICVAGWLEKALSGEFGAKDTTVVFNGIDVPKFDTDRVFPERCGVGLLYSGAPRKRSELAFEAVKELRRRGVDCPLVGFGTKIPPSEAGFDRFELRPSQDEIRDIYSAPKAWLFPSESEGFGLPILEAMAAGTPVIGTPAGAAPDLIHAGNGRLIGHNVQEMADAIEAFLSMSRDEWQPISDEAKDTAEEHGFEDAARQFEAALFKVANGLPLRSNLAMAS